MPTAADLAVAKDIDAVRHLADSGDIDLIDPVVLLSLPAKDGRKIHFMVVCDRFPELPPAWHFRNAETGQLDQLVDIPRGGGFFHSSGVICAPWNRLAYGPKGVHPEWDIGNWRANPQTGATTTIAAMVLRLKVELAGPYEGRMA